MAKKIFFFFFKKTMKVSKHRHPPRLNYYMDKLMFKRCIYINCLIGLH